MRRGWTASSAPRRTWPRRTRSATAPPPCAQRRQEPLPLRASGTKVLVTGYGATTTATLGDALSRRGSTVTCRETGAAPTDAAIADAVAHAAGRRRGGHDDEGLGHGGHRPERRPAAAGQGARRDRRPSRVAIPVDDDGIRIEALQTSEADAVILTPAHQWPTGAVLSAAKRAAIVAWAQARDAVIIEDDYDAEYRYDGSPVGAMQGLAPDRVVVRRVGQQDARSGHQARLARRTAAMGENLGEAKIAADRGSPALEQLALADLIRRGELDRHLRRMRPVYRRRRDVLLTSLRTHLPQLTPTGISAGMHLLAWLPDELAEDEVIARAHAAGDTAGRWCGPTGSAPKVGAGSSSGTPPSTNRPFLPRCRLWPGRSANPAPAAPGSSAHRSSRRVRAATPPTPPAWPRRRSSRATSSR